MKTLTIHFERDLVTKAAAGSREAFDALVDQHYQAVYAHAYRILRNSDDASDATQTTFVKALRSIAEFDVTRPMRPWLYRICGNVCIDLARGRHRSNEPIDKHAYMLESSDDLVGSAEQNDLREKILKAIMNLPEKYRRILILRHYEQMAVEEIAEALDAPEGTIKSWLFRARAMLKKELAPLVESGLCEVPA
ncbi:MAG: RNA polymerase sigma factor [Fimbriimonadales bacterium]